MHAPVPLCCSVSIVCFFQTHYHHFSTVVLNLLEWLIAKTHTTPSCLSAMYVKPIKLYFLLSRHTYVVTTITPNKLTRPIRCCQCSCNSSFVKPFNSLRHVKAFHSEHGQELGVSVSCDVACHVVPDVHDVVNCMLSAEQVWVNLICELLGSVKTRCNLVM